MFFLSNPLNQSQPITWDLLLQLHFPIKFSTIKPEPLSKLSTVLVILTGFSPKHTHTHTRNELNSHRYIVHI